MFNWTQNIVENLPLIEVLINHVYNDNLKKYTTPFEVNINSMENWVFDDYLLLGSVTSYRDRKFDAISVSISER